MLKSAIFLDRDGVINQNRSDHVKAWSEFEFLPGAIEALRRLSRLDWPIVVVSNQAAIGRGLMTRETVEDIHSHMVSAVQRAGGRIDGVFYCPHRPEDKCDCRKPRPGLLFHAAQQLQLELKRSFFVGDAETDVLAAKAVGCRPVLVKTGRGTGHQTLLRQAQTVGYYLADDLTDAANWILGPGWMTEFYPMSDYMPELGQLTSTLPGLPSVVVDHSQKVH